MTKKAVHDDDIQIISKHEMGHRHKEKLDTTWTRKENNRQEQAEIKTQFIEVKAALNLDKND